MCIGNQEILGSFFHSLRDHQKTNKQRNKQASSKRIARSEMDLDYHNPCSHCLPCREVSNAFEPHPQMGGHNSGFVFNSLQFWDVANPHGGQLEQDKRLPFWKQHDTWNSLNACLKRSSHFVLLQLTFEKMGNHLIPPGYNITECYNSQREVDFSNVVSALIHTFFIIWYAVSLRM